MFSAIARKAISRYTTPTGPIFFKRNTARISLTRTNRYWCRLAHRMLTVTVTPDEWRQLWWCWRWSRGRRWRWPVAPHSWFVHDCCRLSGHFAISDDSYRNYLTIADDASPSNADCNDYQVQCPMGQRRSSLAVTVRLCGCVWKDTIFRLLALLCHFESYLSFIHTDFIIKRSRRTQRSKGTTRSRSALHDVL